MWLSLFPLKLSASIGADADAGGTGKMWGIYMSVCVCGVGGWLCRITANQIKQAYWSGPGTRKKKKSMCPAIHLLGTGPSECSSTCTIVCLCAYLRRWDGWRIGGDFVFCTKANTSKKRLPFLYENKYFSHFKSGVVQRQVLKEPFPRC